MKKSINVSKCLVGVFVCFWFFFVSRHSSHRLLVKLVDISDQIRIILTRICKDRTDSG